MPFDAPVRRHPMHDAPPHDGPDISTLAANPDISIWLQQPVAAGQVAVWKQKGRNRYQPTLQGYLGMTPLEEEQVHAQMPALTARDQRPGDG